MIEVRRINKSHNCYLTTIPKEFALAIGLEKPGLVSYELVGDTIILKKFSGDRYHPEKNDGDKPHNPVA